MFEPIELLRETREPDIDSYAVFLCLSQSPSSAWKHDFEGVNWNSIGLRESQYPTLAGDAITIARLPKDQMERLFDAIDRAVTEVNTKERARIESQPPEPPDAHVIYQSWFDGRAQRETPTPA